MDLRVFDQGKLWAALQDRGYTERSFRTMRRWIEQGVAPTPEAERLILEIIGTTKKAAPDGAASRLLTLWLGKKPPPWAQTIERNILSAIAMDRQAFVDQAAAHYAAIARLLDPGNGDAGTTGTAGPKPRRPGPKPTQSP